MFTLNCHDILFVYFKIITIDLNYIYLYIRNLKFVFFIVMQCQVRQTNNDTKMTLN